MTDLTKLSNEDLQALANQDLSKLSNEGLSILNQMQQPQEQPQPQTQEPEPTLLKRFQEVAQEVTKTGDLPARAIIEGVASIPQNIYNTASDIAHLPQIAKGQENTARINTQQYGTKLADVLGLEQPTKEQKFPMEVGRTIAGAMGGAGIARAMGALLPKAVQTMAGANAPVMTGMAAGGGRVGADVAREATQDSDPTTQMIAPIVGGVLGSMGVGGIGKAGAYMTSSRERGADALNRQIANAIKKGTLSDDLLENGLTPYEHELYKDVLPTASMVYKEPAIANAELMARLRNRENFSLRDIGNTRVISEAIKGKGMGDADMALRELNARTTPLRENAIAQAKQTGGFELPVQSRIDELLNAPGTRYESQIQTLTNPIQKVLESDDIHPLDLYARRKALADALNNKSPLTMDELTNAAKNQRREATILKKAIDEGLDTSSGGKWLGLGGYITEHREGMKPINQLQAWQEVGKKFENKPELEPGIPNVTPQALRNAIKSETFSKSGRDLLSQPEREDAQKMINTMNALERARSQRGATSGSQTAPLAMEVTKQLLPDKLKMPINLLSGTKDFFTGNTALDDAILNPEKLPDLIELAIKNKDQTLLNALRNATVRSGATNIGE
jgi:hypothetical protein